MTELNRRTVLAGAFATGATATLNSITAIDPAKASTALQGKQAPGWYRYKVGEIEITVVTDGARTVPL
ncbi:MAG: MBL fold metallo-hydrolase, partial [Pseudolabrys sp.]